MVDDGWGPVLGEQAAYYRALAPDYLDGALDLPGGDELVDALEEFQPTGRVLELACGPGTWTPQLLRHADSVTAVDGAAEMLALAREGVGRQQQVRFVQADLFAWAPDQRYDVVFFGFWLSHVPLNRFAEFWALVDNALAVNGRVFFVDDAYRTPDELIHGPDSSIIRRVLPDGTVYRVVKVPHTPQQLEGRLADIGWDIAVQPTAGPFFWGAGSRNPGCTLLR